MLPPRARTIAGGDYPPEVTKSDKPRLRETAQPLISAGMLLYLAYSFWDTTRFVTYNPVTGNTYWEYVMTYNDGIAILSVAFAGVSIGFASNTVRKVRGQRA